MPRSSVSRPGRRTTYEDPLTSTRKFRFVIPASIGVTRASWPDHPGTSRRTASTAGSTEPFTSLADEHAGGRLVHRLRDLAERRIDRLAPLLRDRAARMEPAPGRQVDRVRRLALQHL